MEGIGGVAAYSHVMMQGVEYEGARKWMADEANACIEGAANAGAKRFCVNDSHGSMHNNYADDLDPRAELLVRDVVAVRTKDAAGRFAAKMRHPSLVCESLREGAQQAGEAAPSLKPLVPKGRNEVELIFLTSAMADMAELIPGTRRSGARAVAYGARDYLEVYKAMLAMVRIAPSAVPPEA